MQKGNSGKALKTVLMIAVMVYAPYAAPELAMAMGPGVSAATAQGLIVMGGTLLINALIPPPKPELNDASGRSQSISPTYALTGGSNRARPHEPLPLVLGTHRIYPDMGARPYTEFEGEDQYLYQVFNFGLSDIDLSDIRIGTTPITDYSDVEIEGSNTVENQLLDPTKLGSPAWTLSGATVVENTDVAPDGTMTADTVSDDSTGARWLHQSAARYDPSKTYAVYFYLKKDAIPRTVRFPRFELTFTGGTPGYVIFSIDASTGETQVYGGEIDQLEHSVELDASGYW